MSKRFVKLAAVAVGSLCAVWAQRADAQEWLKDRRSQNGSGIRTGDFELHPSLAGEIGYDSNYYVRSDHASDRNIINGPPALPVEAAAVLRITPAVAITTAEAPQRTEAGGAIPEQPKLLLNAGLSGTYREYFGSDSSLSKQHNMSADANFQLNILPGRPWGANILATYNRTIQPTVLGNPDLSYNRDDLGAGLEVVAQPHSGTLDWRLGYQFHTTLFEQSQGHPFDNIVHTLYTRGRWKFRPRTAFLYDGSTSFRTYTHSQGAETILHDSDPIRARLGLTGLVTNRMAVLAMAGYAGSFYDSNGGKDKTTQQYDSVIGQFELKFFPNSAPEADSTADASLLLSSIAVGYTRDYAVSYLGDFYGSDRGYAKVAYFFAGRALVTFEGGVGAIEYPQIFDKNTGNLLAKSFTDVRADATLFGEYRFLPTIGVNTTLRYSENFSSTQLPATVSTGTSAPNSNPNAKYDMAWRRFEAYLGVRWFM